MEYTIGAEGKIKINEARGDIFFLTLMSRFGAIFCTCPSTSSNKDISHKSDEASNLHSQPESVNCTVL